MVFFSCEIDNCEIKIYCKACFVSAPMDLVYLVSLLISVIWDYHNESFIHLLYDDIENRLLLSLKQQITYSFSICMTSCIHMGSNFPALELCLLVHSVKTLYVPGEIHTKLAAMSFLFQNRWTT